MKSIVSIACNFHQPSPRRGIATMWVLIVLAVSTAMSAAVVSQLLSGRRFLDSRQKQIQCEWLARSGIEAAAARLLVSPNGYKGESLQPIPESKVDVQVQPQPKSPNVFVVTSSARYPATGKNSAHCSMTREVRRNIKGNRVQLEMKAVD